MTISISFNQSIFKRKLTHDVYTSIDIERALSVGYEIMEYKEIWHYHGGGSKIFRDFMLNIVRRKTECSGFPPHCTSD